MTLFWINSECVHNKAFKRDLARVAFLVCVGFGGYGTVR
nr:hypothetical protein [Vibrio parahaemolyticus]